MSVYYYSVVNDHCSCRGVVFNHKGVATVTEGSEFTPIGSVYKQFYDKVNSGVRGVDACTEMKIMRSCCRIRLLSIPTIPMINRAKDRVYINVNDDVYTENTPVIEPGNKDRVKPFP